MHEAKNSVQMIRPAYGRYIEQCEDNAGDCEQNLQMTFPNDEIGCVKMDVDRLRLEKCPT